MRYFSDVVTDAYGNAQKTVSLTVKRNGVTATIYSDRAGNTPTNPVVSDSSGIVSFYYNQGGTYTLWNGSNQVYSIDLQDRITPDEHGAVGDGTTDDSAAIVSFFAALNTTGGTGVIPAGRTYLVNSTNLFMVGSASLIGEGGTLKIGGTLTDSGKYWINLGIPSILGTPNKWTGFIRGVNFTCTSTASQFNYPVFMHYVEGCAITDNVFDWTPLSTGQTYPAASVEGFNNAAYNSVSNYRKNIRIERNDTYALQDSSGGESYGCNFADKIFILNNTSYGMGDDVVGLHGCTNFLVMGNRFFTTNGRIYLGSCKSGRVAHNYIERIAGGSSGTYYGGGAGIMSEIENATSLPQAPTNIKIHDNTISYPAQTFSNPIYGIRIRGGRKITVANNEIFCDSSSSMAAGVSLEDQTGLTGWTDPDGIDAGTSLKARNVKVSKNRCLGAFPQAIAMGGTATDFVSNEISDNEALSYTVYANSPSDLIFERNSTTARDATGFLNATYTLNTRPVATFSASSVPANVATNALLDGLTGFTTFKPARALRVTAFRVALPAAVTAAGGDIQISVNGGAFSTVYSLGVGDQTKIFDTRTNSTYTFGSSDTIAMRFLANGTFLPSGNAGRIELFGLYE